MTRDDADAPAAHVTDHLVEIREPGVPPRRVTINAAIEVGRESNDIRVADDRASRHHLILDGTTTELVAEDLRTTNGTMVNGVPITGRASVRPGDVIRIGGVEIEVLVDDGSPPPEPTARQAPPPPVQEPPPPGKETRPSPASIPAPSPRPPEAPAASRPALDELTAKTVDGAVLRFRPGTAGERAAATMAGAVRRARRRLAGLGSEPWGTEPQIMLVDPIPDPERPGEIITSGTIVDASRNEMWMIVTPESPPEPLERPLALLFGGALPAGADLELLLEGYGLALAELPDPDPQLRELDLPPLTAAEGELRATMAQSFVAFLIARDGRDSFVRLLATARPAQVDGAAQSIYGATLAALEEAWLRKVHTGEEPVRTGQFIRLTARYLRPHLRRQIEIFVYMLLGLGFTMIFPFAFRRLIDSAIPSGKFSQVANLLVVLGVAFAVSLLAGLRRAYVGAYVSSAIVRQLRVEMFERLQALSMGWFSNNHQGDVLSRLFNDVGQVEAGISEALREGIFQIISLVVSSVVLLTLDVRLGIIVLVGAPLVAVVYRLMAKGAQRRSVAVQEEIGRVYEVAGENYSAQSIVKAFALEGRERRRFQQASDRLFARELKLQLFGGFFGLSVNMIMTMLRLLVLGVGAWLILHRELTLGTLVAFISIMGEVLAPVTVLTGLGQQIQMATGSLVRINEVLESVPDIADTTDVALGPLEHDIRLARAGFSYTTERRTLDGIDCLIPAGSRVAFVGPTGAGKSSVLQLLQRFYDVDDGAVLFDGRDIRHVTLASLRGQIGVVFQESFLFDTTIRENIAIAKPGASDAEIEAAARAAELHDAIVDMPRGYDTTVGERGSKLSGGQRQRLAIARALLRDPRVLLLDEATSALDPRTERLIIDTLERVGMGRTTISVTHRLTSVTDYDRIFVVAAGRLVEQGTHQELVAAGGVYAELWAEQTGAVAESEPSFDAVTALRGVSVFGGLTNEQLATAAGQLRARDLGPGESFPDSDGSIAIVRRGRARVLAPGLTGEWTATTELGPGDAFGVAALLGQASGTVLEAIDRTVVLVLDAAAIAALAADPSVAAALRGAGSSDVAPAGGRRLSRMTFGPGAGIAPVPAAVTEPSAADIRRATGSFPSVRP